MAVIKEKREDQETGELVDMLEKHTAGLSESEQNARRDAVLKMFEKLRADREKETKA
jgi:hypothetical protein